MILRLAIVTTLLLFAPLTAASTPSCEPDCAPILGAVLQAFAEYQGVDMDRIVVDSMLSGREVMPAPFAERPRIVPTRDLASLMRAMGFRLATTPEVHACFGLRGAGAPPAFCDDAVTKAGLIAHAPEVGGDSAEVHVLYYLDRPERRVVNTGTMRFELARRDTTWTVTSAVVESRGVRYRDWDAGRRAAAN